MGSSTGSAPVIDGVIDGVALLYADDELYGIAVRHHHERMDGMGYPDGLVGEEIPFLSRIIAVADAFDGAQICDDPSSTTLAFACFVNCSIQLSRPPLIAAIWKALARPLKDSARASEMA